jgi:hypothetical protein
MLWLKSLFLVWAFVLPHLMAEDGGEGKALSRMYSHGDSIHKERALVT